MEPIAAGMGTTVVASTPISRPTRPAIGSAWQTYIREHSRCIGRGVHSAYSFISAMVKIDNISYMCGRKSVGKWVLECVIVVCSESAGYGNLESCVKCIGTQFVFCNYRRWLILTEAQFAFVCS
jgi:hypothetical protein